MTQPTSKSTRARTAVGSLVLAASTIVGIAAFESYTTDTIIPVPGDVPTYGYGTTTHADGSPLKMGEKTNPVRALADLTRDTNKFAKAVQRCAPVPMYQYEFSAYTKFTYNVGEYAFCHSTIVKRLLAGDYHGACDGLLAWDKVKGRQVRGLTIRRKQEREECLGNLEP